MSRLFELAVGLVNVARGGTFRIDEVDSGLHVAALQDVWRLVFKMATQLDLQVVCLAGGAWHPYRSGDHQALP